jgi:uncharacterized protein (AIM24 family)
MALNPPLTSAGEPYRVEGEHFIMRRKGIDFEVKINGLGKMKGKGMVRLTFNN